MLKGKSKYYDISHMVKDYPDCQYYMVFGERSNGKTYSAMDYCIERYFKYGENFAYIRRFAMDIRKKNLQTLFAAHIENGRLDKLSDGKWNSIVYYSNKFCPIHYDGTELIRSEDAMGYAFDLNSVEHHKSTSYPKVTTVVFDEFLSRNGYLTNEFVLFMNTLSTIIRDRKNVKIFMIGNTVNKYCPYFMEMGLSHVKEQKPGTVDIYNYADTGLKVAVEYCSPMSKRGGKESDIYFAFDNPQLKMITGGSWEIAIYPHLDRKYKHKDIIANFFIDFDGTIIHGEIVVDESGYFMFVHPKTTPIKDTDNDIVYSNLPNSRWNWRIGLLHYKDKLTSLIQTIISENKVFYSDNETGEVLRNFIMWSGNYSATKGGR